MNAIGIDLGSHGIRLVQVSRKRGILRVLGSYATDAQSAAPAGDSAALGAWLAEAIRKVGVQGNATLVAGLPYEKVFFSRLQSEVAKRQEVRRLLKFELEDDLPVPFDELVADVCSHRPVDEGRHEYLIAAVSRAEIDRWRHAFDSAGWRCSIHSTDVCALAALTRLARPEQDDKPVLAVHVDGSRMVLALVQGAAILCARHAACTGDAEAIGTTLAREIELTWRGTLGRVPSAGEILLSGPEELVRELTGKLSQATGHAVGVLDPLPAWAGTGHAEIDGRSAIALGLALVGLDPAGEKLDFLHADLSQVDEVATSHARRAALVSLGLVAVLLAVLGVRTFQKLHALEAERVSVGQEIRTVYTEAFPEDKKIVNEAVQIKEHLTALRRERDLLASVVGKRVQPLGVLYVLSEKMTAEKGIGVSSFSIKDKTIHLVGTGKSFDAIEKFVQELRQVPEFGPIELEDMAPSRGSERPEFRLLISMKAG